MNKRIAYLELDVHKNSITMALFIEQRQEEEFTKKIANNASSLLKLIKKLSEEYHLKICYEASRCGYSIYRKLIKHGFDCIVVAPSLIPTDHKKVKKYQELAKTHLKKDKRINIRISRKDLEDIQRKAITQGLPYQTLIASIIHKYNSGLLIEKKD